MPVNPTYPGVYIEEIPSGVRTIVGVATSIAAFVGYFSKGPMDKAVHIYSRGDFEREFGGLQADSEAAYAIEQFFLNGGTEAWVVRTAKGDTAKSAQIQLENSADGAATALLQVSAANPGQWGNLVRLDVDWARSTSEPTFNLVVTEYASVGGIQQPLNTELFRNLVMDSTKPNHVVDVVNEDSKLIQIAVVGTPPAGSRPAQTGTISKAFTASSVTLSNTDTAQVQLNTSDPSISVTGPWTISAGSPAPTTLSGAASMLQTRLRGAHENLKNATVTIVGEVATTAYLQVKSGTRTPSDVLAFSGTLATKLGLDDASRRNVQEYALGGESKAAQLAPGGSAVKGANGDLPEAGDLKGSPEKKTGLYALEEVDLFNILCLPDTIRLTDTQANDVASAAEGYCEKRRAFYILDVPHKDKKRDDVEEIKAWLSENGGLRHKNSALYYPRPRVADPLKDFRLREIAPSGTMAGLYARTDASRGLWKSPAGTEAVLRGVQELEYQLTDAQNGTLNPLAINCFRFFETYGRVSWGARTLVGADQMASEWKYIPVRRLALYIEESLYRGTQWAVFEPNDEPLWAQLRLNIGAFMHNLFRQGAFQGSTPRQAYLVKCDGETTTQADIDRGIVNILVGFAPLKPAEFVIIKIQQLAGQNQA